MMTPEQRAAKEWFESLSNDEIEQLVIQNYRAHLKHVEELKALKALGFKWGVEV